MLILAQIFSDMNSGILTKILSFRSIEALNAAGKDFIPKNAEALQKTLSRHFLSMNLPHRITIYDTLEEPRVLFMNIQEPFPPEMLPSLVSLLATQDRVPPYHPLQFDASYGDFI